MDKIYAVKRNLTLELIFDLSGKIFFQLKYLLSTENNNRVRLMEGGINIQSVFKVMYLKKQNTHELIKN